MLMRYALIGALLGGCTGSELPSARVLAEDEYITSVAVRGTHVYWSAWGPGDGRAGRVMRGDLDGTAPLTLATDQARPAAVVAGDHGVYWGNDLPDGACDNLRFAGADGVARPVRQDAVCRAWPVTTETGMLTTATISTSSPVTIVDLEPSTEQVARQVNLGGLVTGLTLASTELPPRAMYLILQGADGGVLARLAPGATAPERLGGRIAWPQGLVATAQHLYWVDGNRAGEPPGVWRMAFDATTPEWIMSLEPDSTVAMHAAVDGGLWLVDTRIVGDQRVADLLRIDEDTGALDRYPLDYAPHTVRVDGHHLIMVAPTSSALDAARHDQILEQALP